jgi:plasmid stability protein
MSSNDCEEMEMFDPDYRRCVSPHLRAAMDRLTDPHAVWEIFRDDATVAEMERLTALKRPAVEATSQRLLALGEWVRQHDPKRTFGKLARQVMEANGYVVDIGDVKTPKDPLFTKGTRYRLRTPPAPEPGATTLIIRNVGPGLRTRLEARAVRNGRAAEAEALHIVSEALSLGSEAVEPNLAEAIRRRFASVGGVNDLEPHPPVSIEPPPSFEP